MTQTVYIIQRTIKPLCRIHVGVFQVTLQKIKENKKCLGSHQNFFKPSTDFEGNFSTEESLGFVQLASVAFFAPPFYLHESNCNAGPVNHSRGFCPCADRALGRAHSCRDCLLKDLIYAPCLTAHFSQHGPLIWGRTGRRRLIGVHYISQRLIIAEMG